MKESTRKRLAKTWGYVLLPVILYGWFVGDIGYGPLAIVSAVAASFFLFQARVPRCGNNREVQTATGEPTFCRNNAKGLLRGCWIEAHKWHNAKMMINRSSWGRLPGGLFRKFSGGAASFAVLFTNSCAHSSHIEASGRNWWPAGGSIPMPRSSSATTTSCSGSGRAPRLEPGRQHPRSRAIVSASTSHAAWSRTGRASLR